MTHEITTPFGDPGYLVLSGSRLYGIDTPESDYDYLGAIVEPLNHRVGLTRYNPAESANAQHGFEQHMFKGYNYEGSVYSLWKLCQMFAEGNPTSLCLLFAEPIVDEYGINTDEFHKLVISRRSGHRFLKYMEAQRKSMTGERASHTKRPELTEAHGFDTKFASHVIRLGYQGIEFLKTGHVTLPMPHSEREHVLAIRRGEHTMQQVIADSNALQAMMEHALARTTLPAEADWNGLDAWLIERYLDNWGLVAGPHWGS